MREERQGIMAELRNFGDGRTIVLYTNDNRLYRKVLDLVKPIKIVPYEQEQEGKLTVVGVDLYFPKEERKRLEKSIGIHTSKEKVHKTESDEER